MKINLDLDQTFEERRTRAIVVSVRFFFAAVLFLCWDQKLASADPLPNQVNYFIGNSLSWDILNGQGIDRISSADGAIPFRTSQHVRCGSSLTNTIANPHNVCTPTGYGDYDLGLFQDALSKQIDVLALQPFYGSTLQQEIDSIKFLVDQLHANPENQNTRVFIYETWGNNLNASDFLTTWNTHQAILTGGFTPSASTYAMLQGELLKDGYGVGVISAGRAFAMAAEKLKNGSIGNLLTDQDLYRDQIHASNAGRYLAALTAYSAISGLSPDNLSDPDQLYPFALNGYGTVANGEAAAELRSIAAIATGTAIPEPSTFVLGMCLATLLTSRRRRRS